MNKSGKVGSHFLMRDKINKRDMYPYYMVFSVSEEYYVHVWSICACVYPLMLLEKYINVYLSLKKPNQSKPKTSKNHY